MRAHKLLGTALTRRPPRMCVFVISSIDIFLPLHQILVYRDGALIFSPPSLTDVWFIPIQADSGYEGLCWGKTCRSSAIRPLAGQPLGQVALIVHYGVGVHQPGPRCCVSHGLVQLSPSRQTVPSPLLLLQPPICWSDIAVEPPSPESKFLSLLARDVNLDEVEGKSNLSA